MCFANFQTLIKEVSRRGHQSLLVAVALIFVCHPINAQVGALAELLAAQQALKGLDESIEKTKTGAQDTVNMVQADIATDLIKIQRLIEDIRKGVIKDTDAIVSRTIE